ncbi:hypothetical protein MTYP_01233 [Methylophilaceae bacterium]|nr:hypothetical protein MTYP_01233 [Methylophilaceae bacterium]
MKKTGKPAKSTKKTVAKKAVKKKTVVAKKAAPAKKALTVKKAAPAIKTAKAMKNVTRIPIKTVDLKIASHKGLFDEGCYGSQCQDECCGWGCDIDYATIKLILKNRDKVEALTGAKVEDCFKTPLKVDDDYVGGAYRETAVRKSDKLCCFHLKGSKGCSLFYLWIKEKLPKRIVPTICRTYPVTWHRGKLFADLPLKKNCKAKEKTPKGVKVASLFETQKKELKALFDIPKKEWKKLEDAVKANSK